MNKDIEKMIDYIMPFIMQKANSEDNIKLLLAAELERLYQIAFNEGYELQGGKK